MFLLLPLGLALVCWFCMLPDYFGMVLAVPHVVRARRGGPPGHAGALGDCIPEGCHVPHPCRQRPCNRAEGKPFTECTLPILLFVHGPEEAVVQSLLARATWDRPQRRIFCR
jgi:hypothetical protein